MPLPRSLFYVVALYLEEATLLRISNILPESFWRQRGAHEDIIDAATTLAKHTSWKQLFFPTLHSRYQNENESIRVDKTFIPGTLACERGTLYDRWGGMHLLLDNKIMFTYPPETVEICFWNKDHRDINVYYHTQCTYKVMKKTYHEIYFLRYSSQPLRGRSCSPTLYSLERKLILPNKLQVVLCRTMALCLDIEHKIWSCSQVKEYDISGCPRTPVAYNSALGRCVKIGLIYDQVEPSNYYMWFLLDTGHCFSRAYQSLDERHFINITSLIQIDEQHLLICQDREWFDVCYRFGNVSLTARCRPDVYIGHRPFILYRNELRSWFDSYTTVEEWPNRSVIFDK